MARKSDNSDIEEKKQQLKDILSNVSSIFTDQEDEPRAKDAKSGNLGNTILIGIVAIVLGYVLIKLLGLGKSKKKVLYDEKGKAYKVPLKSEKKSGSLTKLIQRELGSIFIVIMRKQILKYLRKKEILSDEEIKDL